ncbi:MAG: CapA family protein [Muribaculum sp.]|nr:CapA family protein [Muribaculum sp.]
MKPSRLYNYTLSLLVAFMFLLISACVNAQTRNTQDTVKATRDSVAVNDVTNSLRPDTISFAFVGDIMMGTIVPEGNLPANDGKDLFTDVLPVFNSVDIVAGNLEGPVFDGPAKSKPLGKNSYAFRTPAHYIKNLVDADFDFVGVANNHASDFGATGRTATQRNLKKSGIAYAGIRGECETAVIDCKGLKIGFTQFGHSNKTLSILDYNELNKIVNQLRDSADIVVVSFHGGAEGKAFSHVPHTDEMAFGEKRGNVEKFAHAAIDAGADIVFGHGPHVPRAAELYKDRVIFYSLGNFCTPYQMNLTGISGYAPVAVVNVDKTGKFLDGRIHSYIQKPGKGPKMDNNNAAAKYIKQLTKEDFPTTTLRISDEGSLSVKRDYAK